MKEVVATFHPYKGRERIAGNPNRMKLQPGEEPGEGRTLLEVFLMPQGKVRMEGR